MKRSSSFFVFTALTNKFLSLSNKKTGFALPAFGLKLVILYMVARMIEIYMLACGCDLRGILASASPFESHLPPEV